MNLLLELKTTLKLFRETLWFTIPLTLLLLCMVPRICKKMVPYPPGPKGLRTPNRQHEHHGATHT